MFNVSRQGLVCKAGQWADVAAHWEDQFAKWYRNLEGILAPDVCCTLALWSNQYFRLAAVASLTVARNPEAELVIDVGFHRTDTNDKNLDFSAELCRENGPPLAILPSRKISLDYSDGISKEDAEATDKDIRTFLLANSSIVIDQLAAMHG